MNAQVPGALVGGRYRLVQLAGRGGMAEVWRAELLGSEGFRRPVALKRILRHLVHLGDHRAMFVEEARLTAQLDHPNVVQVYDFGDDEAGLYIAMEWVEGLSLRDFLDVCRAHDALPSPSLCAAIGIEVLRALEAAHENTREAPDGSPRPFPIVHRDVSPSNVMLSVRGVVKLADFGLARAVQAGALSGVTPTGVVKGKLTYLAPEVVKGKPSSPVTDLYSTGVLLWEAVAGRRLHAGMAEYDIVRAVVQGARPPLVRTVRPDTPEVLAEVLDRALAVDPAERFQTAASFARALSDALRTIPERTDTSRLAREFAGAAAALRSLRPKSIAPAGLAAAPASEATGPQVEALGEDSVSVSVELDPAALDRALRPSAPPRDLVADDPAARVAADGGEGRGGPRGGDGG